MQIVIDIDKDVYNALHGKNTKVINMLDILNAIRNGTVLPEKHGRLIDVNDVEKKIDNPYELSEVMRWVNNVPIILEATEGK